MRAALYIRVSTEEQAKHGLSLPEQRDALSKYADANNMEVIGVYEDAGISARKPYKKRPALLRLLEDCNAGKIDVILFIKLDRWFRNVSGYYAVQDQLDKCGVKWQATQEDYETRTASGRLKVNIMLSVAQDEADRTSERIKFINDGKRAKGQPTNAKAPLGLVVKDRQYQIDPDTAEAAKDMFSAFIRLRGILPLRKYMAATWGINRAYSKYVGLIQNRLYIGEVYGIADACPALINKDEFSLANELLKHRSQRGASTSPDRTYLFSGLLHCRECGTSMQSETAKKIYTYYRCRKRMLDNSACPHNRRIREDVLEEYLLKEIEHIATAYHGKYGKAEKKPAITADKIKRKMQKLKELYLADLIDIEEYRKDYEDMKRSLEIMEASQPPAFDVGALKSGLAEYPHMTKEQKKGFWTRTIQRIDADNDGAFFVTPR